MKKLFFLFSFMFIFYLFSDFLVSASTPIKVTQGSKVYTYYNNLYIYQVKYNYRLMSSNKSYSQSLVKEINDSFTSFSYTPRDEFNDNFGSSYNNIVYYVSEYQTNISAEEMYNSSLEQFTRVNLNQAFIEAGKTAYGTPIVFENIVIQDTTAPSLVQDGWNGAFVTNVNNPTSIDYIKTLIKAYDETDGEVEVYIKEDNYTPVSNTVGGPYSIIFASKDKANNEATITIQVYVIDNTSPTLSGPKELNSYMSSPLTIEDIKKELIITDNYSSNFTINEIANNWTNKYLLGSYPITFISYDESHNKSNEYTINIHNIDDIKPSIQGETKYVSSNNTLLNLDTILTNLTASDNIDTNLTIEEVANNYTYNSNYVGTYSISYKTTDSSNNESELFIVSIEVIDEIIPLFYVSDKFIAVSKDTILSNDDLVKIICLFNNFDYSDIITSTLDNKISNEDYYEVSLTLQFTNNETKNILQKIYVYEEHIEETKKEDSSFLQRLKEIFLIIWNFILKYFLFGWLKD